MTPNKGISAFTFASKLLLQNDQACIVGLRSSDTARKESILGWTGV